MNTHTMDQSQPARLEMRWLPVVDATGRTRMEATWVDVSTRAHASVPQAA